jgi:hypothetical protein
MGEEDFNNNINNIIQQHCAQNNTLRARGRRLYYITPCRWDVLFPNGRVVKVVLKKINKGFVLNQQQ